MFLVVLTCGHEDPPSGIGLFIAMSPVLAIAVVAAIKILAAAPAFLRSLAAQVILFIKQRTPDE